MRDSFDARFSRSGTSGGGSGNSIIVPLPPSPGQSRILARDATTANLYEQGYKNNSIIQACISKMMIGIAQAPLMVVNDDDKKEPAPQSKLQTLLNFPNPFFSMNLMLQATMAFMAIGGDAYWYKVRDGYGQIVGFYPYHASQIQPISSSLSWIDYYLYNNGSGYTEALDPNDVVHFRWNSIDFVKPYKALPPLLSVAKEIDIDNEALAGQLALILNSFIPSIAIVPPDGVTMQPKELYAKAEAIQERFSGKNRGKVMVLQGGGKVQKLGFSLRDIGGADGIAKIPESRIPAVFGIPITMTGLLVGLENAHLSNQETDKRKMAEDCLVPNWKAIESAISRDVKDEVFAFERGKRYTVVFDLSKVAALKDSIDSTQKNELQKWNYGLKKRKSVLLALGDEPCSDEDDVYIYETKAVLVPALKGPEEDALKESEDANAPKVAPTKKPKKVDDTKEEDDTEEEDEE